MKVSIPDLPTSVWLIWDLDSESYVESDESDGTLLAALSAEQADMVVKQQARWFGVRCLAMEFKSTGVSV